MPKIKLSKFQKGDILELTRLEGDHEIREIGYLYQKMPIFKIQISLRHPNMAKKQRKSRSHNIMDLDDMICLDRSKPISEYDDLRFGTPVEIEFFSEPNVYKEVGYVTETNEKYIYTIDRDPTTYSYVDKMARQRYVIENIEMCCVLSRPTI